MYLRRWQKTAIAVLVTILLGGGLIFVFSSDPTRATGYPVFDFAVWKTLVKENIEKIRTIAWKKAGIIALDKAVTSFINRMAEQTGTFLATGGKGKTSLIRRESFGSIIRKSGEAALGDFIQDLSDETELSKLGLNLCNPSAQLKAQISLQLLDEQRPQPLKCDVRKIQENWQRFSQSINSPSINVSYGNQFGVGGGVTAPGFIPGTCEVREGQCGFSGVTQKGVCESAVSSAPEPVSVSQRTYCNSDSDCGGASSGLACVFFDTPCSTDNNCKNSGVSGVTCVKPAGAQCVNDPDCGNGLRCVGGGASSGIPWIDLTRNLSVQEKVKTFNDLFSPEQSDLGAYTFISAQQKELQQNRKLLDTLNAQTCKDYKDIGSKITDDYVHRTCGELEQLAKTTGETSKTVGEETDKLFAAGDSSFWLNAAKIFGRSLVSGLLKKYIKAGSFSLSQIGASTDLSGIRQNIVQQLRTGNTSPLTIDNLAVLNRPSLDKVNNYDYIANFTLCPDDRNNVELDNCTIDDNFASAIREKKTVADALADGSLNPNLALISNLSVSLNSDPFCVRNGYCHSNIVRLRKYRIIPIGWEIAASLSPIDDPITLGEAVNCFENSGSCKYDAESNIFFHLIDPGWVLKAPETQCKALAYGPKLLDIDTSERQKYCADPVSCLAEDDDGNCVGGYGYCTKEKPIWRFEGTQCPSQYASCSTYSRISDGATFAYLGNTVDSCDASQNGCLWYSKSQDNIGSVTNPVYQWNPNDRIYFNNQAQKCDAAQVGCTQFISLNTPGVNLITNGDFDSFTGNSATDFSDPNWLNDTLPDSFKGWSDTANTTMTTRDNAYYGTVAARLHVPSPAAQGRLSTNVTTGIVADKTFTLSWLGKGDGGGFCSADVSIGSQSSAPQSTKVTYSSGWKRFELSASFDASNLDTQVLISFQQNCTIGATALDYFIDGVKFELNNASSGFTKYGENGFTYGKSQFQCTKDDVGCDKYKPANGDAAVPARISSTDLCPSECVGYQTYLQLPGSYDVLENPAVSSQSVNFIAATGKACPAAEVNCEEFTNLEEVSQGGEGKYYFDYIRQCVEDPLGITYYTLEGSDTAGYQARTWRLLESTLGPVGNRAPCTNVDIGGKTCIDDATNTVATTCKAADLQSNLDCREFFDAKGNPHYVLQSRVIIASTDCQTYRRTSTGTTFYILKAESRTCQAQFNGCREYRGNQVNNLRILFEDTFESGDIKPWALIGSLSSESVTTGGHSLSNKSPISGTPSTFLLRGAGAAGIFQIEAGRDLYVDFWMKNDAPVTLRARFASFDFALLTVPFARGWQPYHLGPLYINQSVRGSFTFLIDTAPTGGSPEPVIYVDNIILRESVSNAFIINNSWKTPASCDTPVPGAMLGCRTYTNSAGTSYNLKSFSHLCSEEVIGCQEFIDTKNSSDPFQQIFNQGDKSEVLVPADSITYFVFKQENLCFSQDKGCSALGKPQLNLDLPENHPKYINGYSTVTLINNPDTYGTTLCTDAGLFCEEYTSRQGTSAFFKDPRGRICSYKENVNISGQFFTGWFQSKSLDPGKIPIGCSDDGVLPYEANDFKLRTNLEYNYDRWVGQCSSTYDRCTEFKDPTDTQGDTVLANDNFDLGETAWSAAASSGNTLTNIPGGGASDLFQTNSVLHYATTRTNPTGIAEVSQSVSLGLNPAGIYVYSAEVNMQDQNTSTTTVGLNCQWDSPSETDYCWNPGTQNYSYGSSCTSNADCSSPTICKKYSPYYCENAAAGVETNTPCFTSAQCAGQLGSGYTCNTGITNNKTIANRDHAVRYQASGDPNLRGNWQVLTGNADLGKDSVRKQLVQCDFIMTQDSRNNGAGGFSVVLWQNASFKAAKGYYYLDNEQVDTKSCSGQVGKSDGCLLFMNMNERSSKLYNAAGSYQLSKNNNGSSVNPVSCDPADGFCQNDSNRIIKVLRDRQCVEWLACRSATEVFDTATNSFRQLCDQVGTCDQYTNSTDVLSCAHWVTPSKQKLEYGLYTNRAFDTDSADYTGYSMYNHYSVGTLELVDVSTNNKVAPLTGPDGRNPDYRLVRVIDTCDSTLAYEQGCGPADPLNPLDKLGRCFAPNKCVIGVDGSHFSRDSDFVIRPSTRAWAEKDSPFPYSVIESETSDQRKVKFGFQQSNICDSKIASCENRYYKFTYGATAGSITKYFSADLRLDAGAIPGCLCQGGKQENQECLTNDLSGDGTLTTDERCPDNGAPLYLKRAESFINLPGYCLEQDYRANINASQQERACLNWLPVDNSPTGFDFYNQNREAGYSYKIPAYYCLEVGLYEIRKTHVRDCRCSTSRAPSVGDSDYYISKGGRCGSCQGGFHKKYRYYEVPKGGDGIYSYDGDTYTCTNCDGGYSETKPDGSCQVLAQAVDERGENAAKTNLFWTGYPLGSGRGYDVGTLNPPLGYKLAQDDTPFGSAVPPGIGFITTRLTIRPTSEIPRAGSPYACSSSKQSCALFDQGTSAVSVAGWKKSPGYKGLEFFDTGLLRLKEIYKKIFNLYKWAEGNICSDLVCAREDDPDGTQTGGYFAGKICDPADFNSCNSLPNNASGVSCSDVRNKCVNSVFNDSDPASSLFNDCAVCEPGFHTEQRPTKRCESDLLFTDTSAPADGPLDECNVAPDFDPNPGITKNCTGYSGYACGVDPSDATKARCYSPNHQGNDCKIPFNPDSSLIATYLTCQVNTSTATGSCYYAGYDTGVACDTTNDCIANDDTIVENNIGALHAVNKTAYCADANIEGTQDYGTGSFCVGTPFTDGTKYIFENQPVHCEASASVTNDLGYSLSGSAICTTLGKCLPSYQVKYAPAPLGNGQLICTREPVSGYLPLCIKQNPSDCAGIPASRVVDTTATPLKPNALPLDETANENPRFSPYIIPAVCDASGINCKQSKPTAQFNLPNVPVNAPGDNGFTVNNILGTDPLPQNNEIVGFQNVLASLRFYMVADKNHLPIRYVDLDWGDGLRQSRVGYYKNYLEQCGDPAALGPLNGQQEPLEYAATDQACREAFRNYLHVYPYDAAFACGFCSISGVECGRNEDCTSGSSDVCNRTISGTGAPAACYRPRVMVQDNWGWCTGNYYGETGLGCKDTDPIKTTGAAVYPEPRNGTDAYVKWRGLIRVYRDPKP